MFMSNLLYIMVSKISYFVKNTVDFIEENTDNKDTDRDICLAVRVSN